MTTPLFQRYHWKGLGSLLVIEAFLLSSIIPAWADPLSQTNLSTLRPIGLRQEAKDGGNTTLDEIRDALRGVRDVSVAEIPTTVAATAPDGGHLVGDPNIRQVADLNDYYKTAPHVTPIFDNPAFRQHNVSRLDIRNFERAVVVLDQLGESIRPETIHMILEQTLDDLKMMPQTRNLSPVVSFEVVTGIARQKLQQKQAGELDAKFLDDAGLPTAFGTWLAYAAPNIQDEILPLARSYAQSDATASGQETLATVEVKRTDSVQYAAARLPTVEMIKPRVTQMLTWVNKNTFPQVLTDLRAPTSNLTELAANFVTAQLLAGNGSRFGLNETQMRQSGLTAKTFRSRTREILFPEMNPRSRVTESNLIDLKLAQLTDLTGQTVLPDVIRLETALAKLPTAGTVEEQLTQIIVPAVDRGGSTDTAQARLVSTIPAVEAKRVEPTIPRATITESVLIASITKAMQERIPTFDMGASVELMDHAMMKDVLERTRGNPLVEAMATIVVDKANHVQRGRLYDGAENHPLFNSLLALAEQLETVNGAAPLSQSIFQDPTLTQKDLDLILTHPKIGSRLFIYAPDLIDSRLEGYRDKIITRFDQLSSQKGIKGTVVAVLDHADRLKLAINENQLLVPNQTIEGQPGVIPIEVKAQGANVLTMLEKVFTLALHLDKGENIETLDGGTKFYLAYLAELPANHILTAEIQIASAAAQFARQVPRGL